MNTTRQSKTWPYDLVKGIILLILVGLMLYSRPDLSAQIQRQLGLPFGTVTELDAPQPTGDSPTTLSGHTQSGAIVEVFAGEASLGTATAGADGSWSLPVTLPAGSYQLRAQARDEAGTAVGSPAVLEWSSEQQAALAVTTDQAATDTDQEAGAESQAGSDTSTETADNTSTGGASRAPAIAPPELADDGVTFTGSGEPGTTILVVSATGTVGTAQVSQDGTWTLRVQLAPGKYELQARATDASGAAAGDSPVVVVAVPAASSPNAETESVAAAPAADTAVQSATTASTASTASSASAQGSLGAAQVEDGTANLSGAGTPGTTVELVAIAATRGGTAGTGAVASSAGNKSTEIESTGSSASAAAGAAQDAAPTVVLGSAVVAADGTWQLSARIDPGEYALAVRTLDADGATVDESAGVPLSVPAAPGVESPATDVADQGSPVTIGTDAAANTAVTATMPVTSSAAVALNSVAPQVSAPVVAGDKATLTGLAAPGAAVELVTNDEILGTAVADTDGLWVIAVKLDPGSYALRVRAVGEAEEPVQYSRVVSLTVPAAGTPPVAASETLTPAAAAITETVALTSAKSTTTTAAAPASATVSATVSGTGTVPLAAPAVKGTSAVTPTATTSPIAATTVTTGVAATTTVTTAVPTAATNATTSTAPSGPATPAAQAASTVTLTATAAAVAATPSAPPTLGQPEISGSTLTLSGTGTPGTSVEIVSGKTVLGKATVGADGTWSLAAEVKPGSYKLQVVRKDAAGKVISQSPVVSVDIPSTEAAPVLDTPQVAADNTITLTGSGEPGSEVEIVQDGAVIATADVQNDGQWSYAYPAASPGNVQVAAQVSGQPATRTRPVIVVVPVIVAPAAPAPAATDEASTPPEQTADDAGSTGGQAYVVQPGDTLTGLAQEYLGSETRYQQIIAATNEMAKQDPAFKPITDPNLIVVGQQVWIPAP